MSGGKWTSRELYHGEEDVAYAEPDETGGLLVILEHQGGNTQGGNTTGHLYSVQARKDWYYLGLDPNVLGATFNTPSNVAVSAHSKWIGSFPILPLSQLQSLAESNLSAHCRAATAGDYRSSPCWPSFLD